MNTTPEQLERSLHTYADSFTAVDPDALVAGAARKARQRRRTRATAAAAGGAAVALAMAAVVIAARPQPIDGKVTATPFPSGISYLPPLPADVAKRAKELKVAELGPGIRLAAMQELELQPNSTTPVTVPKKVRGREFTATGRCRPTDSKRFTEQDRVAGFTPGGSTSVRCSAGTWPTYPTHLNSAAHGESTLTLVNKSPRAMKVTVFYALPVAWNAFPFQEYALQPPDPAYDPVTAPGARITTIRSTADPRRPRSVTFSAPKSAKGLSSPLVEWGLRSEAPGRFRILVDGASSFCRGDAAARDRGALCRDGVVTLWRPAQRVSFLFDDALDIDPGARVTVRVEPLDVTAPWSLEVRKF